MDNRKTKDIIDGHEVDLCTVYQLLGQGESVKAIKIVMEQSGIGLKEAKKYVDQLKEETGIYESVTNEKPREKEFENEDMWNDAERYHEKPLKRLVSEHHDISDHSLKRKVLTIIEMWAFWGVIYGVTHVPVVREAIINFVEANNTVHWLSFWSDILLNDLLYVAVIFLIGSIAVLMGKQKYNGLKIYNQGMGFLNAKDGQEQYATYEEINLNYGKGKSSVRIECKKMKINEQFYFKDFSQPDIMENNLERFGTWGVH